MNNPYSYNQNMGMQTPSIMPNPYPYQDTTESYQKRLLGMAQQISGQGNMMNNQFQPNTMQGLGGAFASMQGISVRAVTGYEEAMASQIPLDGSISIFTDFSHGNIYTKQLNMSDGTALMKTYKLGENPTASIANVENSVEYVKKSEFDELRDRFNEVWEALTDKKTQPKAEKKEGK